jgi:hypothetical protein
MMEGALERLIDKTSVERTKAKRGIASLGFICFPYILFEEFKPFPLLASIYSDRQASIGKEKKKGKEKEKDRAPFHHPSIRSFISIRLSFQGYPAVQSLR